MKRPRFLRPRWLILGLFLLPLVCWALLLVVIPTGWARKRIVAALSEATGRPVRLEALHVGAFGGVRLSALAVGAPDSPDDPWLQVADASTDLNLIQLLAGCCKPTEVQVKGLNLRVLRRKDGTLELSDLLRKPASAHSGDRDSGSDSYPTVAVRLTDARIVVIDEPSQTNLEFSGVEGSVTWNGPHVRVNELHGALNGGTFELAAQLDRGARVPTFEGQVRAHNVAVSEGMDALAYVVPALAGTSGTVNGQLDLNVYLKGEGISADDLKRTLAGKGVLKIDPAELDGSQLLADLEKVIEVTGQSRAGAVKTDFIIKEGRIGSEDLTLQVGRTPIVLTGWTDFDGRLDYRVKTEDLVEKLPGKARDFLSELQIDLKEVATVRVHGTHKALVVSLDGVPLNGKPGNNPGDGTPRLDDKQRLKDLSRRLKDRFLR